MKDTRKFIDKNRELFDDKEPTPDHEARFEALLDKLQAEEKEKEKPVKKIRLFSLISAAACIVILIGVAIKFYAPNSIEVSPIKENGKTETMKEFHATNEYYNQQMEEQIADIMCKLANTDTENQAQLTEDLQEIIDANKDFVKEIAKTENKEIAIKYLVKHYKSNIQTLENINEKLGKHTKC
jgi:hypothetical protein